MIALLLCLAILNFGHCTSKSGQVKGILTIKQTGLNSQVSYFVEQSLEEDQPMKRLKRSPHDDQKVVIVNPNNAAVLVVEEFNDTSLFEANWIDRERVKIENEEITESETVQRNKRQSSVDVTTVLPNLSPSTPEEEPDRYINSR